MISINAIDLKKYNYAMVESHETVIKLDNLLRIWNSLSKEERSEYTLAKEVKILPSREVDMESHIEMMIHDICSEYGYSYDYVERFYDRRKLKDVENALDEAFNGGVIAYEVVQDIDPTIDYIKKEEV